MVLLVAVCLGGHTGCAVFSKTSPVKREGVGGTGLIKPVIPPDGNQPVNPPQAPSASGPASAPSPGARDVPEQKDAKGLKREWEDQKVTKAALERAASLPSIKKIQVCYIDADDEWTVFLYSDIGPAIEIKQFYWNRDAQTLEPHLVFKQIPKSRLQETLNEKRPGYSCESLDPPKR
jgi:hypothetical protein